MEDAFEDMLEEVKRAEHLYYVSLKYTRTVDVLRSCMERFISTYEYGFKTLLLLAKKKKKIKELPESSILQVKELETLKLFEELRLQKHIDLYRKLRKLIRLPYTKREEYRRHVTMTVETESGPEEINIDIVGEYFQITFDFLKKVRELIHPKGNI